MFAPGPPSGPHQRRWPLAFSSLTGSLSLLSCVVFAYWRRGRSCCAAARAALGCSADPSEPCRGLRATCSDLLEQFALFPQSQLGGFRCEEFPRTPQRGSDAVVVGLVAAAITFGVRRGAFFPSRRE